MSGDEKLCSLLGIYAYDKQNRIYLLEVQINQPPSEVDLSLFYQKDDSLPESDWQTAYDEQYLSSDGTSVIGDGFDSAVIPGDTTRVAFFMFLEDLSSPLTTPYGDFPISNVRELPERLSKIIVFDPLD